MPRVDGDPFFSSLLSGQDPAAAEVLLARAVEVGAEVKAEGPDFGLLGRQVAVGGQLLRIDTTGGPVNDVFLPLFGEHMARNAALSVAAVEAFLGGKPLSEEIITEGLASVDAPARLELVKDSPAIVLDTAHNVQAARATIDAVTESFAFSPMIGVVAMMADKDSTAVLQIFSEQMDEVVITRAANSPRGRSVEDLASEAEDLWPSGKVHRADRMAEAIEMAATLADAAGTYAGVLIAGSVIAAGEARDLLVQESKDKSRTEDRRGDDEE